MSFCNHSSLQLPPSCFNRVWEEIENELDANFDP